MNRDLVRSPSKSRLACLVLVFASTTGCADDGTSARPGADAATTDVAHSDAAGDARAPDDAVDGTETDATPERDADAATDGSGEPDVGDAIADADADGSGERLGLPGATLEVAATCTPSAAACAAVPVTFEGVAASYRKDAYFPDEVYPEYTDAPIDGGRFHIATIAEGSGSVTDVIIDGSSVSARVAPPDPTVEWWHVWPDPLVAGEPVWVAFHSRAASWDTADEGRLQIETGSGTAVDVRFAVDVATAPITWVTLSSDGSEWLVHVRNDRDEPATVDSLFIDGRDVLEAGIACLPDETLAAGEQALWRVPTCTPPQPGSAYTVVVEWTSGPPSVAVGRHLPHDFIIEAWPNGSDCTLPTEDGETESYRRHVEAGFDTVYLYWGAGPPRCETSTVDAVNRLLPARDDMRALIGDDFPYFAPTMPDLISDTSAVVGFLTGDESDGEIYDDDGAPVPEQKAERARALWRAYPELPVYNGAKTNGHVGTFAGMTDIQGMDLYAAACAPHITPIGSHPLLRTPYDYLRNTRDNHMPWPTWLYAQGLHSGWNWGDAPVQPAPQEVLVQGLSVMAAGGKGLMWFQTTAAEADRVPESWAAIAQTNRYFDAVRHWLYEGDPTGDVRFDGEAIVEAIRARDAIVVPVINLATTEIVDDARCLEERLTPETPPRWVLDEQEVDLAVTVPSDMGFERVVEVLADGSTREVDWSAEADSRTVWLYDVALSNDVPVRLFVLLDAGASVASSSPGD